MRPPAVARRVARRLPPAARTELLHRLGHFVPWEDGFDFTPPQLRPGEVAGPPDFVGVGVQKAGTSWWYALLSEHPGVYGRDDVPKERHYLSRFCVQPFGEAEILRYHGWFPRRDGTITGEWTPDYFGYPWVPPVLARAAPEAKVLVLLRDPIERLRSGLTFRVRHGAPASSATAADAVRQGFYAWHLRRLLDHIPPERVLLLQYERCQADPVGQLDVTHRFLGLDPFRPDDLRREVNVSGGQKVALDEEARRRFVELYAEDVTELGVMAPAFERSLWPNFVGLDW